MSPERSAAAGDDEDATMIAYAKDRRVPEDRHHDVVERLRLVRLQHSTNPQAAAIATSVSLLLPRLDRLIRLMEDAA